ncbi:MAG TPA: hypothetical protein P5159_08605 [Phycisphaerae bacterium]|nr:hypothetical protein [Phycisphaerae bacterium]
MRRGKTRLNGEDVPQTHPAAVLAVLVHLVLPGGFAAAQTPPIPAASDKSRLDESPYVDGSFGFSIRTPAGSIVQREKKLVGLADVEIVRFVQPEFAWSLVVRLSRTSRALSTDLLLEEVSRSVRAEHQEIKPIRSEAARFAGREGVRFAATFTGENQTWLRQQAVITKSPTEYYSLILLSPVDDQAAAASVFERIATSFEILRTEETQREINEALRRGQALIQSIAADPKKLRSLAAHDDYLFVLQGGKEIGFVHIHSTPFEYGGRQGVAVREWSWVMKADGTTQLLHDMFEGTGLPFSRWETMVRTISPIPAGTDVITSLAQLERGIRQDDTLLVTYTRKADDAEMKDKAITIESSFASPAFLLLLPRLVDLAKPELYAFSAFSTDRRGLSLRTFRILGQKETLIDGRRTPVFTIQDSEGLLPPVSELLVDGAGRLLRVSSGPVEMVGTTQAEVERRYKNRVDAALAIFQKKPVRLPMPPDRSAEKPGGIPSTAVQIPAPTSRPTPP